MEDFFQFVYGEGEGFACITRNDINGAPTHDRYFEYPQALDKMVEYCTKYSHENIYFTPTLMETKSRKKAAVKYLECAFGDADTFPVEDFLTAPSLIVHTSPVKTHVYWKLTDATDPLEVERLNHAVSIAHPKAETDMDVGWAANKLLRVPGTSNLKYAKSYKVNYEITGEVYDTAEFEKFYPKAEASNVTYTKLDGVMSRLEAINSLSGGLTSGLEDILSGTYGKDSGRFKALHLALHELFRAGASNEAAFAIVAETDLHKWKADGVGDADQRLWDDVLRARATSEITSIEDAEPLSLSSSKPPLEVIDFLSPEERASLKPTFVDMFVEWSASKTNTAKEFQVAAGLNILSTVFSDFGHIPMHFGNLPLNLWFLVSGRSTVDRKTTVLNHMLRVLRALSDEQFYYNFGSDFTISALSDQLLDRPNRSGLVHVDEFQGFLAELGKNYMSGTKEALTAMYGGSVKGKLRATSEKKMKPEVDFALSFYAMGITTQIAEALTREDFLSGFLTRFLWVSPPEDYVAPDINDGFELVPLNIQNKGDQRFMEMVGLLRNAREWWEFDKSQGLDSPTDPVRPTEEAFARVKQFRSEMVGKAVELGREELISSADRLSQSVLKCAALLAMVESKEKVELHHVISAIQYANAWFENMIRMVDMVSDSSWMKLQEEIIAKLIENGSSMDSRQLYKHFKTLGFKPRDFAEHITALQDSGEIQQVPAAKGSKKMLVNYIGGAPVDEAE